MIIPLTGKEQPVTRGDEAACPSTVTAKIAAQNCVSMAIFAVHALSLPLR